MSGLTCAGCGHVVGLDDPAPFRCPRATDGREHVLGLELPDDPRTGTTARCLDAALHASVDANPFLRYRELAYPWHVARARGLDDDAYVALVEELDRAVATVDGHGFTITPYRRSEAAADVHAPLWVKDETGQVGGSHKARHLFGVAVWLAVAERTGLHARADRGRSLAIASCGNAALAAAVVARAIGRPLRVFVPPSADAAIVARLTALEATIEVCPRRPADPPGDPCVHRFREAVAAGALPFTCQGPDCGLTIDGGVSLGLELAQQDAAEGAAHGLGPLERVVVQVGGGALATALARGLRWARTGHAIARAPAVYAVQTEGCFPLVRAWRRVATALTGRITGSGHAPPAGDDRDGASPEATRADHALAEWLRPRASAGAIDAVLASAAGHRAAYMWPWEREPHSAASGILDDETYDWLAVVRAMLFTGGHPVIASEAHVRDAHARGKAAGLAVSATGSAGLAGVLALASARALEPRAGRRAVHRGRTMTPTRGSGHG